MSQQIFEKIVKLLNKNNISYQLFEHQPVYTSEEAAKIRDGTKLEQGAKALVMMADKKPILIVISGARRVDTKKFKRLFKIKDLRMSTPDEVKKLTDVKVGAVPPFGKLLGLEIFVDQSLGENEEISFNAGLHTKSVKMKYQDWFQLVKPKLGNFADNL